MAAVLSARAELTPLSTACACLGVVAHAADRLHGRNAEWGTAEQANRSRALRTAAFRALDDAERRANAEQDASWGV